MYLWGPLDQCSKTFLVVVAERNFGAHGVHSGQCCLKGGVGLWDVGADICEEGKVPDGIERVPYSEATQLSAIIPFVSFTDKHSLSEDVESDIMSLSSSINTALNRTISKFIRKGNWSIDETMSFLAEWGVGHGHGHAGPKYNIMGDDGRNWNDPTKTPLPYAPSMKIYCLYGVGLETERAFFYKRNVER
jgi:hypothetical protein